VEKWNQSDLKSPLDWFFRTSDWRVVVYSTTNPATAFSGLELAIDRDIVEIGNLGSSYVYVQNFVLRYGAGCGINGNGTNASHLTFRDLDISYIGGGNLGGLGTRYGNGIQFRGYADNNTVERNRIWQIFDTGLTNQSTGTNIVVHHIIYRNNVLWNMSTSFEIWLHPSDSGAGSAMHDIYVLNNTAVNPGGWGFYQHTNGNGGFALVIGTPAGVTVSNILIVNNAFADFPSIAIVEDQSFSMWKGGMYSDYNDWFHAVTPLTCISGFPHPFTSRLRNGPRTSRPRRTASRRIRSLSTLEQATFTLAPVHRSSVPAPTSSTRGSCSTLTGIRAPLPAPSISAHTNISQLHK
jgi:hypothetical protein